MKGFCVYLLFTLSAVITYATPLPGGIVRGYITARDQWQPVPAATVTIPGIAVALGSNDGFFSFSRLPAGRYLLVVQAAGYVTDSSYVTVNNHRPSVLYIRLQPVAALLDPVTVTHHTGTGSEAYGRLLEKESVALMHVVSAQSINQFADITVADAMQRVSSVSVLRDETGLASKAVVRGMDSKYSYTSVNGMVMPSADSRSRYLSPDLLPAGITHHIEVYKTLTAAQPGNAIGGVVNMVTRPVPDSPSFSIRLATGYSQLFLQRQMLAFNSSVVKSRSPYERYGAGHMATGSDFTKANLSFYNKHPLPDVQGAITWSRRFFAQKLGILLSGGSQAIHTGADGFLLLQNNEPQPGNIPGVTDFIRRQYSNAGKRSYLYTALDYRFNTRHHLRLYQLYTNRLDIESRSSVDTSLAEGRSGPGTGRIAIMQRSRLHRQAVKHLHLQGDHRLGKAFTLNWSGVYATANGSYPDWAELTANTGRLPDAGGIIRQTPLLLAPLNRQWLRNKEKEAAVYAGLQYTPAVLQQKLVLSAGTLLQHHTRDNFYNAYLFNPAITSGNGQAFGGIGQAVWLNNNGPQNPFGSVSTSGTYTARENIDAWYTQASWHSGRLRLAAGLREERTAQQVYSAAGRAVHIRYHDWLPSLHLGYTPGAQQELKLSYYRALSRPSLYDITFFNMEYDDYNMAGNPFIQRTTADNIDLRYQLYAPALFHTLQLTFFYKQLYHPYERTLLGPADTLYPVPSDGLPYTSASRLTEQLRNYGTARNYGLEFLLVKYFHTLGITAGYTYTSSRISQAKKYKQRANAQDPSSDIVTVTRMQQRPLQGQSKHLAQLGISYRMPRYGCIVQLVAVYTGKRISEVSGWYGLDNWQKGYTMLDLSLEKTYGSRWRFFAKATNLLNAGTQLYLNGSLPGLPGQTAQGKTLVETAAGRSQYLVGVQYNIR
jgi:hypothetical protein